MRRPPLRALLALLILATAAPAFAEDAGPALGDASDKARGIQDDIRADPALMEAVESLRSDPIVQDLLHDPSVKAALRSGDIDALLANPKIGELLERPAVQDITRELGD